jgi:ATP-binding cassette, subfamily B, bacterial PglK
MRQVFLKFYQLLTPVERKRAIFLIAFMFVGMVFETLGIGLIIPFLSLMTEPDIVNKYPDIKPWLERFGGTSQSQLIVWGMLFLVGIHIFKAVFLVFLAWRQAEFSFGLHAGLSARLFNGYLRQPYTFHLQRNSAQLIRNVTTEVSQFTSAIISASTLLTELFVLIGIGIMLFIIEPVGATLTITILGIAGYLFYLLTNERLLRWGDARQFYEGQRIQHLQQGLGGAKEVKLLGREENFINQYAIHNSGSARMSKHENVLQALPRLWLELLAIVGLAILVISMLSNGKSTETLIPIIGLFAAAAFRMMPSVNRILVSIQGLRYNLPVISSLYKEAQLVNKTSDSTSVNCLSFKHEIHLKSVGYSYEGVDYDAISNINLIIPRGKSVGIIGESGAGKSTLVDVILGLLTPTKGTVEVDGIDVQFNLRGWQNHIGYVSQTIYLTDDTLRCNIAFGLEKKDINDKAIKAAINASQLQDFVDSLPDGLDTMVGERGVRISGGQRQRIGIARALYHNPSVLVLDEATSALDTVTEAAVMKSVYELQGNKTVIIIAHRLSAISMCDLFFELNKGNLIQKDKAPC